MGDTPATSDGPVSAAVSGRPPFGPMERLPHDRLLAEQHTSVGLPRRRYSLPARAVFTIMDGLSRERGTLEKFMYVLRPTWSYRLNADVEDFADDFGSYDSLADLFGQIGYDERLHRLESESNLARPRFG